MVTHRALVRALVLLLGPGPFAACNALVGNDDKILVGVGASDAHPDTAPVPTEAGLAEGDSSFPADVATCASGVVCNGVCASEGDVHNCGGCGADCAALPNVQIAGVTCGNGKCLYQCVSGYGDCNGSGTGCPDALSANPNCGSCNTTCTASQGAAYCGTLNATGMYGCLLCPANAPTLCGNACVDTTSDANHCGSCDDACLNPPNGVPVCTNSQCTVQCDSGFHVCFGQCLDRTSISTCGASCVPCPSASNATTTCDGQACGFSCVGNFEDCDGDASNGCETDLAADGANCGSCGRSCQGQACTVGQCTITTIADGQNFPYSLFVDANNVYWTNSGTGSDGTVVACSVHGCSDQPRPLAAGLPFPHGLAVDGTNVYWTNNGGGSVMSCPIAGCNNAPTTLAIALNEPESIAVDATNIYWTNTGGGSVMRCDKLGCVQPNILAISLPSPWGIAVDLTSVYWTNNGITMGSVMDCPITGCASPTTLAQGFSQGFARYDIAVDSSAIYWTDSSQGLVMKVARDGSGTITTLATGQNQPCKLALDATNVYWANEGDGTVVRCAVGGCAAPMVLASQLDVPCGITVDATSVYWATSDNPGIVQATAK